MGGGSVELETTTLKKVKLTVLGTGSRGRLRSGDIDGPGKPALGDSFGRQRTFIATVCGFPDREAERDAAGAGFTASCQQRGFVIPFTEPISALIIQRGPQMRGEIKTKARPIVELLYDLKANDSKSEMRARVEHLLDRFSFVYQDPSSRKGIFDHEAIKLIIAKVWFHNKHAEGIKNPAFSDGGIPLVTMALVLTAIENVLDEWITGEHINIPFSSHSYRAKYESHLKTLTDFAAHTQDKQIVPQLRQRLLTYARRYAQVDEPATVQRSGLSITDFDAAAEEWAEVAEGSGTSAGTA
ncbi:hypothetical protein BC835DRAFT_1478509 [Cytidiella melzeri]|nr:hypothetical protein BC835DRAFT_1472225 [Cytidiella melzeri]KAI0696347.1 hypothetical protein BC835DRAFT_1478509 [Cytidiella melzeri]